MEAILSGITGEVSTGISLVTIASGMVVLKEIMLFRLLCLSVKSKTRQFSFPGNVRKPLPTL